MEETIITGTQANADDKEAVQKLQKIVVDVVRSANALPRMSSDYELYSSFPAFAHLMQEEQQRVLILLNKVLQNAGCRPVPKSHAKDSDELLDHLVEANDSILERAGILLDALSKAKRSEQFVLPEIAVNAESTLKEAKKVSVFQNQGRYAALLHRLPANKKKDSSSSSSVLATSLVSNDKPQNVHKIMVDNSKNAFVSKLKVKHHSKSDVTAKLTVIDESVNCDPTWPKDQQEGHPYKSELTHFMIPERQMKPGSVELVKPIEETELVYIDSKENFSELVKLLNDIDEFSVDLEHNSYRSYLGLTCLIQISTRQTDYIIDPFPIWEHVHLLNESFTNPNILKVFHGADSDVQWLQRDFGVFIVNMFDTQRAMRALNFPKFSLQTLISTICNLVIDKKLQKADWRYRPLTEAHIAYARSDTHFLLHCYDHLRKQLIEASNESSNLLRFVYDQSSVVCQTLYEKPIFEEDGYEKLMHGRKPPNTRQRFALAALWKWRDEVARTNDESVQYVLPNHMLLQIGEVLPREMQGILACCSPVPMHVKHELLTLHHIINTARDRPLEKNSIHMPNLNVVTFESVIAQQNKMSRLKALLSCHLDFSSTKFNEEICALAALECGVGKRKEMKSDQEVASTGTCIIGHDNHLIHETSTLQTMIQKLDDWATPFECYCLSLRQKAEDEMKKKQSEEEKKIKSPEEEKKLWSHLDPPSNKPGYLEEKSMITPEELTVSIKKRAEQATGIDEEMTLTKKALKRRRKMESGKADIETSCSGVTQQNDDHATQSKKSKRSNWTAANEQCNSTVDYDKLIGEALKRKGRSSEIYDPFEKNTHRGKIQGTRNKRSRRARYSALKR